MESNEQPDLKPCFVKIEPINLDGYSSDSSIELPELPCLILSKTRNPKIKKSNQELLLATQNLVENIQVDDLYNNDVEEKLKSLEMHPCREDYDNSLTPPPSPEEKKYLNIFCVNDKLQFFNLRDVTLSICGYANWIEVTKLEKELLSSKRVELQHVISSVLFSSNAFCISDCKSFVTYLLRILSVSDDVANVHACFNVLKVLLIKYSGGNHLAFSSAEILMLLFNHGVNVESFKFLQQWPDILKGLEVPESQSKLYCRIPETWTLNLKLILNATMNLISTCSFKTVDLTQISIFFLWMSLDSIILQENLFSTVRECISVCIEKIRNDKWEKSLSDIARTLISMEFSSEEEKWRHIYFMTKGIPVSSERGIQLQKQISLLALNSICLENIESDQDNCIGYDFKDLSQLLKKLIEIDTKLLSSATKFIDICITHLSATKEEYQVLCNIIKCSESVLNKDSFAVKANFMKIHAKLKLLIGRKSIFQIARTPRKIKIEVTEDSCRVFPATPSKNASIKIKTEIQEACTENESSMLTIEQSIIKSELNQLEQSSLNASPTGSIQLEEIPCRRDHNDIKDMGDPVVMMSVKSCRRNLFSMSNVLNEDNQCAESDQSSQDLSNEITDDAVKKNVAQGNLNAPAPVSDELEIMPTHKNSKNINSLQDAVGKVMAYRKKMFHYTITKEEEKYMETDLSYEISDDDVKKGVVDQGNFNAPSPESDELEKNSNLENCKKSSEVAAGNPTTYRTLFNISAISNEEKYMESLQDSHRTYPVMIPCMDSACEIPADVIQEDRQSNLYAIPTVEPEVIVLKEVSPSKEEKIATASQDKATENLNINKDQPVFTEKVVKISEVKENVIVIDDQVEFEMDTDADLEYIEPETKVPQFNRDCQENIELDSNEVTVERHSAMCENVGSEPSVKIELSKPVDLKAVVDSNELTVDRESVVKSIELLPTVTEELSNSVDVSCASDFVFSNTDVYSLCKETVCDLLDSIVAVTDVCFACNENEVFIDKTASVAEESILQLPKGLSNDSELPLSHNLVKQKFETEKNEDSIPEAKISNLKHELQSISDSDNFFNSTIDVDDRNNETDIDKCFKDALLNVISYRESLFGRNSETRSHPTSDVSDLEILGRLGIPIKKEETLAIVHTGNQNTLMEHRSNSVSPVYSSDITHMLKINHSNQKSNILSDLNQSEDIDFIKTEMLPSHSPGQQLKRKHPGSSIDSSPKIKKYDIDSKLTENDAISLKRKIRSQSKSSECKKSFLMNKTKSPNQFFNYLQRKQKYIVPKNRRNIPNIIRQNILSDKNKTVLCISSDDSDPEILYCDPKKYADKECLIIYESEELVVLDSD